MSDPSRCNWGSGIDRFGGSSDGVGEINPRFASGRICSLHSTPDSPWPEKKWHEACQENHFHAKSRRFRAISSIVICSSASWHSFGIFLYTENVNITCYEGSLLLWTIVTIVYTIYPFHAEVNYYSNFTVCFCYKFSWHEALTLYVLKFLCSNSHQNYHELNVLRIRLILIKHRYTKNEILSCAYFFSLFLSWYKLFRLLSWSIFTIFHGNIFIRFT